MLSFEEKIAVLESFPELQRKEVSLGRINFHYEESSYDKKIVAYHIHPNGNGFVYAAYVKGYAVDDKGLVNIREYSADELRTIVEKSIQSLTRKKAEKHAISQELAEERWIDGENQILRLTHVDELWYVYDGDNLESAFETYEEAEQYMLEEGFTQVK
ncbi:hypothetical protein GK047_11725 [Paenibacillus sp. SYP-B3998]|uniref:Uncharacterized protein n=1 Tax=Paenibacillus sp. SYP-B3998 TaxID=2678564 RepID=A0A6G3ZWU2_9BACL|nr:hypothetical protein [Paenibacillus sp. SYP-B3998]NEW06683.1 hypothetical protein [Paenibacillus sp. SYP-B3998]